MDGCQTRLVQIAECCLQRSHVQAQRRPSGWAFLIGLAGMIAAFVIANGAGTVVLIVTCGAMFMMLVWFGILLAAHLRAQLLDKSVA